MNDTTTETKKSESPKEPQKPTVPTLEEKKLASEHFHHRWAGWQSMALTVAIVGGGIYTVLHRGEIFPSLNSTVSVDLKAEQLTFPTNGGRLVRVDLLASSNGFSDVDNVWLDFNAMQFEIQKIVEIKRDGNVFHITEPWNLRVGREKGKFEHNATNTYEAIQSLPEPGLYKALLSVPLMEGKKKTSTLGTHILFVVK